jgi:hypothetical protein
MFSTCLIGYTYLSRFRQGCENTRVENKVKESSMVNKLSYLHLIKLKTKLIQLTYHSCMLKLWDAVADCSLVVRHTVL